MAPGRQGLELNNSWDNITEHWEPAQAPGAGMSPGGLFKMRAAGAGSTKGMEVAGATSNRVMGVSSQEMKPEVGQWKELMEAVKEETGQGKE